MRAVALVSEAFGGFGGIAQYNRDFLSAFAEMPSCEHLMVLPRVSGGEPDTLPASIEFRHRAGQGTTRYLAELVKVASGVQGYDLVVCGHIHLLPLAEVLRRRFGVPLILIIYGIDAWRPTGRPLVDRLAGRADVVVSISEFTAERFAEWAKVLSNKVHILPNAVRAELYGVGEKPPYLVDRYGLQGKRVLLTLGRLFASERYKGVDEVLEILPALLRKVPDLHYMIAGDGDDRLRLKSKARTLGVAENVIFTGRVPTQEKADHYRLADAFVMAGRGEGFGFVFLEAMACGVPVVASTLDGSREAVLQGALGVLIDPDNREDLEAGILEALSRPREVPRGLKFFSYQNFSQRLRAVIDSIARWQAHGS